MRNRLRNRRLVTADLVERLPVAMRRLGSQT